jgi:hypothetical protein
VSGPALPITLVITALVVFAGLTFFGIKQLIAKGIRDAEQRLRERLVGEAILLRDDMANGFGLRSRGPVQLRGNGVLVLTRQHLAFAPLFRDDPIIIELARIRSVDTTRSHLGKSIARDLLSVEFDDDQIVWYVRDLPAWIAALRR